MSDSGMIEFVGDCLGEIAIEKAVLFMPASMRARLQRRGKAALNDLRGSHDIASNEHLTRAARFAWIEATKAILAVTATDKNRSADQIKVEKLLKPELSKLHAEACNPNATLTTSPIDVHVDELTWGLANFVAPGAEKPEPRTLNDGFAETIAKLTGWPICELPAIYAQLANSGIAQGKSAPVRDFATLVFAKFADLLKSGDMPEAWRSWQMAQHATLGEKLANDFTPQFEAILGKLDEIAQKQDEHVALAEAGDAKLDQILAAIGQREGVPEKTILALAKRIAPQTQSLEQALIEIEAAIKIALEVRDDAARGTNFGDEVDEILRRLAALNDDGQFDDGADLVNRELEALEEAEAELNAKRIALLEAGIDQEYLRRDAEAIAAKLVLKAELELPAEASLFDAPRTIWTEWYERGRDKGLNFDLEVAIELARHMSQHAVSQKEQGDQFIYLGVALQTLGKRESGTARLQEAVTAYRAALEEWTRDRVPLDWAMTQNNLGNALQTLGERESDTARLEEAVTAYRGALEEHTRDRVPLDWAMTQNNLGNALQTLGQRESGTARLQEAVTAYHASLEERTRDRVPMDWAMTQNNLGNALQTLGQRESGAARLEEAVTAYRAALEEYTRDRVPMDWAMTQNNLGNALQTLGQRESGTARLEEAVTAYHASLEERTRDRVPMDWAMTQNNLGNALRALGERESGTARLEEALTAFRAALEEYTRDHVPLQWATTQNNLGNALQTFGERESDTARLEEAVTAYHAALEERTRDRVPLEWGQTRANLALVFLAHFEKTNEQSHLDDALGAVEDALEVYREAQAEYYIEKAERLKLNIEAVMG
ncbi:MAG: tetratricopeptide repeat protein [Pseudomonadota bacterium]